MIDWRVWLLSALARKLGLPFHVAAQHHGTGARAFLFAESELVAHGLALQFCLQQQQAHEAAAEATELATQVAHERRLH